MARKKTRRRRSLGEMSHPRWLVAKAAKITRRRRNVPVTIRLGRNEDGTYIGMACVARQGMTGAGRVIPKNRACGVPGVGATPTKTLGAALKNLGEQLLRIPIKP